ncbi:hypothetical protein JCM19239_6203 [Vibrio variabilis]|uniref:Uncharacterized protein n=1 Tax=Vibrio variabilis TaxID=990271 RepID=A0ABQ0JPS6_9VIBR|nr:hypothetical protein JCM19239_6203 [Vibrio variabilis]
MSGITATDFEHQRDVTDTSLSKASDEVLLSAKALSVAECQDIDFALHKGEILGFAGLGARVSKTFLKPFMGLKSAIMAISKSITRPSKSTLQSMRFPMGSALFPKIGSSMVSS